MIALSFILDSVSDTLDIILMPCILGLLVLVVRLCSFSRIQPLLQLAIMVRTKQTTRKSTTAYAENCLRAKVVIYDISGFRFYILY